MNTQLRGAEVIRRAENAIRALIAEATESSQYEDLLVLAEWARRLHALIPGADPPSNGEELEHTNTIQNGPLTVKPPRAGGSRAGVSARSKRSRSKAPAAPVKQAPKAKAKKEKSKAVAVKKTRGAYPKFMRDGENLVKIGWSKKEKTQYEHKSPKSVLDQLLESLRIAGGEGHRFTTEDILPLHETDGAEIPSYQSYLCLAWLRSEKLIEQHGRQGYSLPQPGRLTDSAKESWERLARR